MKRKEGISTEEFRRFWNSPDFNELIDRMMGHVLTAEVKKNLTLDIDINRALQEARGARQPFDGVLEIVWQSGGDLAGLLANEEFQRLTRQMEEVQRPFVDFEESRRFFTEYQDDRL